MHNLEVLADVHVDQQTDAVLEKELLYKIGKTTMSITNVQETIQRQMLGVMYHY